MDRIKLRLALMTSEALKLKDWEDTEWYGSAYPYAPYWDVNEYLESYGYYKDGKVNYTVQEDTEFICVFKNAEFLCSFELWFIPSIGSTITIQDLDLLKA